MPSRWFAVLCAGLIYAVPAHAQSLLVPTNLSLPPLALVRHEVEVTIEEQISVTKVTQVFRNSSSQPLEATYIFPVPKGANVNHFSMWVNGKEEKGELVEAEKARQIYTDIVRRAQDPGLLEYVGQNLLKVRVFPVPANGDQKLSLTFTAVSERDQGLVEYVYPLKSTEKAARTLEKFRLSATLKAKHTLQNVYSPTHPVTVKHHGDHKVTVSFERQKETLDKDFHLYYGIGNKDVGLTALVHRPDSTLPGHVMLLLSPRAELGKAQQVARDMVFVVDTSGSMAGVKMEQARKALKYCLNNLTSQDRFALIHFASTVNKYSDELKSVNPRELDQARKWVDGLEANGGTAIDEALKAAAEYRPSDAQRSFTVVFFTDGQPTVGEEDPEKILKSNRDRNTAGTRIFTFGVGDDVNAVLLDRLAEQTRAVSTYVRPEEDIEAKVSGLYAKISHPVLTNLKMKTSSNVRLSEVYPNQLPDLFHGGQLVVLARYEGKGHAAVTVTGQVGAETKEFTYEIDFPGHTGKGRTFVEGLWARRKVGYLLDQIRQNGEKAELKEEVVKLAKKHGITTPYTSYLVVPESVTQTQTARQSAGEPVPTGADSRNRRLAENESPRPLTNLYRNEGYSIQPPGMAAPGSGSAPSLPVGNGGYPGSVPTSPSAPSSMPMSTPPAGRINYAPVFVNPTLTWTLPTTTATAQTGKEGVDLALQLRELRQQDRLSASITRQAAGRTCVQVGDAWIDQGYDGTTPTVKVRTLGTAYFDLLARHPELKEVLQLGKRIVWITPSGIALIIDPDSGADKLGAAEIDKWFVKK